MDEHGLARHHIAHHPKAQSLERDRLRRHQVLGAGVGLGHAVAQRPDAERIAEREHAIAGDLGDHGIGAAHPSMDLGNRLEDGVRVELLTHRSRLQFVGQHVEQHFGIGLGVDVPAVAPEHVVLQLLGIGQVAVVDQRDPEGRVDIERLGLFGIAGRSAVG
jgi:hypothetical protein